VAAGFAAEEFIPACSGLLIEWYRRVRCRNRELEQLQGGQFRGDEIVVWIDVWQVPKAMCSRDGELRSVVESRIEEPALAMQLEVGHKGIPVRHRTPANPRMQIHSAQAKRGRNERSSRNILACDHAVR